MCYQILDPHPMPIPHNTPIAIRWVRWDMLELYNWPTNFQLAYDFMCCKWTGWNQQTTRYNNWDSQQQVEKQDQQDKVAGSWPFGVFNWGMVASGRPWRPSPAIGRILTEPPGWRLTIWHSTKMTVYNDGSSIITDQHHCTCKIPNDNRSASLDIIVHEWQSNWSCTCKIPNRFHLFSW